MFVTMVHLQTTAVLDTVSQTQTKPDTSMYTSTSNPSINIALILEESADITDSMEYSTPILFTNTRAKAGDYMVLLTIHTHRYILEDYRQSIDK